MRTNCIMNGMKYTRRFNLGNYEHEEISVDFTVEEGANATDALNEAMDFVLTKGVSKLGNKPVDNTPVGSTGPASEKPSVGKKEKKAANPKKEEAVEEETKTEPEAKEEKVEAKVEDKPARKTKVLGKVTKYSRTLDLHKKLMSEILDSEYKGWRASPTKAKDASVKLENDEVDFLDAEGKVLESFREALAEAME